MDREKRAREAVREFLALVGDALHDDTSGLYAMARRRAARAGCVFEQGRLCLTGENTEELATLISEARVSPIAYHACHYLLDDLIQKDRPIPDGLALFCRDVLRGDIGRQKRNPAKGLSRKRTIETAVYLAVEQGLPAYSGGESSKVTACDVVAEEINLSPEGVASIWKNRPKPLKI